MDDLISRQAAVDAVNDITKWYYKTYHEKRPTTIAVIDVLKQLPPAQPERKTGAFIGTEYDGFSDGNPVYYEWECSECGCVFEDEEPTYNYCPNCGAEMLRMEGGNG